MISALMWALVGGTVIGLLGKLVAPGDRDNIPLWLTVLCGIAGGLLGNALYLLLYDEQTRGVDWWRHSWQVAAAAALVAVASGLTGRSRT